MFREKIYLLCKKPFPYYIYFNNNYIKKARILFASLLSKVVSAHVIVSVCHEQTRPNSLIDTIASNNFYGWKMPYANSLTSITPI